MNEILLLFLRRPVLGKVKTRLAADTNDQMALEIYNWLLEITHSAFKNSDSEKHLYFDSTGIESPAWANLYDSHTQIGDDLGMRMQNAFARHLSVFKKVVLIGCDCPEMDTETLSQAFRLLNKHDVVFGPARDGGVYLIGMKNELFPIFSGIEWGSEKVLSQLLESAEKQNYKVGLLSSKSDIDFHMDFIPFEKEFENYKFKKRNVI